MPYKLRDAYRHIAYNARQHTNYIPNISKTSEKEADMHAYSNLSLSSYEKAHLLLKQQKCGEAELVYAKALLNSTLTRVRNEMEIYENTLLMPYNQSRQLLKMTTF